VRDAEARELIAPAFAGAASVSTPTPSHIWADLGCGTGTFTRALADLLGPSSVIHAVDRDHSALQRIGAASRGADIRLHHLDISTDVWPFRSLDGLLMANALHYVADQTALLRRVATHLPAGASLLLVEYDTDHADRWVPYPVPLDTLERLVVPCGFGPPRLLGTRRSAYGRGRLYAALCLRI